MAKNSKHARTRRSRRVKGRPARMLFPVVMTAAAVLSGALAVPPAVAQPTAGAAMTAGAAVTAAGQPAGATPVGFAPALPAGTNVLGPASRSERLQVTLALRSRDPGGLDELAQQVSTPSSGLYRQFLSPPQVEDRFGPSPAAVTALRSWLRGHGLKVMPTTGDGLLLPATGSVAQVEKAFQTPIRQVRLSGGRVAYANSSPARVPASARAWVTAVLGLDNLVVPQPLLSQAAAAPQSADRTRARPSVSRPASAGPQACPAAVQDPGTFTAGELAHAYGFGGLYRRGDLGQGTTVALFELADYANHDIDTYTACYGISPVIKRVPVDGGTTISASGEALEEATADIETVAGLAPQARILVYEAPPSGGLASFIDEYGTILQQDRAQVVSSSYGYCEQALIGTVPNFIRAESLIFASMAVQGQSMLAASGDSGSEGCLPLATSSSSRPLYRLAVSDPASQPYVTGVGGTAITRYGSPPVEAVWNQSGPGGDGSGFPAPFDGQDGRPSGYPGNLVGGGGMSNIWAMPAWQRGFDTSGNSSGSPCHAPSGQQCREVPDVSALAAASSTTPGYAIYGTAGQWDGKGWTASGGTSLATPLWAALTLLADERIPGNRLGLLTPALYQIDRRDPAAFNDVKAGENDYLAAAGSPNHYTCTYHGRPNQPCYEATKGYDMATGLGSPEGYRLATDLANRITR
jgi:subtilase family serine protease